MVDSDARAALAALIEERGEDFASLSRMLGRNAAYVQQFIKRGTPRRLAEHDRRMLARYFGVSEERLGGQKLREQPRLIPIPRLALGASAGLGALGGDERARDMLGFGAEWLRAIGAGSGELLSMIRVEGDSMQPVLSDGDEIMVDRGDGAARLRDGIYVLRIDDGLMVKRLALNPATRRIDIRSDNSAYPSWADVDPATVEVIGRVIWMGRRVR